MVTTTVTTVSPSTRTTKPSVAPVSTPQTQRTAILSLYNNGGKVVFSQYYDTSFSTWCSKTTRTVLLSCWKLWIFQVADKKIQNAMTNSVIIGGGKFKIYKITESTIEFVFNFNNIKSQTLTFHWFFFLILKSNVQQFCQLCKQHVHLPARIYGPNMQRSAFVR